VTVATFLSPHEAYLARGVLASAGVECVLLDEHMSQVYGRVGGGIVGGMRLQVRAEDESAARALLATSLDDTGDPQT